MTKQRSVVLSIPEGGLPLIDKQHNWGALQLAIKNPSDYPNLYKYIKGENTGTVKIIQSPTYAEARQRAISMNTKPKAWTPLEQLLFRCYEAIEAEADGQDLDDLFGAEKPRIITFMAWYSMAKDMPIWKNRMVVDSGVAEKIVPSKRAATSTEIADQTVAIYLAARRIMTEDFDRLNLEEKATVIKNIIMPYFNKLIEYLPKPTGDDWFNYLLLRTDGTKCLIKCLLGLLRVYEKYRYTKPGNNKTERPDFGEMSLIEFANNIPNLFLDKVGPDSPFKSESWWESNGSGFANHKKAKNIDSGLKFMWETLNIYKYQKWNDFIDSVSTNPARNYLRDFVNHRSSST